MSDFEVCPVGTQARLAAIELVLDRAEQCAQTEAARADKAEAERDALRAESDGFRAAYGKVCGLVADMHAAATGRPGEGPRLGVVEDVAAVRAERDALRAALEVARRVIAHDRQSLIDCSTNPAGAIDRDAAEHVAYYDAALAQMDEATKGGGNG